MGAFFAQIVLGTLEGDLDAFGGSAGPRAQNYEEDDSPWEIWSWESGRIFGPQSPEVIWL